MRMITPYGSWRSPISAEALAAGVKPLAAPRVVGGTVYWLEGLPSEAGRVALMRAEAGGAAVLMTPAPFNVRSRVHEYGGGAYGVVGDSVCFSNFADNRVYRQQGAAAPQPLTRDSLQRHADFEWDAPRRRLIAVREDHASGGTQPSNLLVALPLDDDGAASVLASGFDFYAAPRLSPDGRQLAWLCWNHPRMPWDGTELWLADVGADGQLAQPRRVAGGPDESLCQPLWSPGGTLYVVSDRSGWWNLYRVAGTALQAVCPMAAEFGRPQWTFGQAMYGFAGDQQVIAACIVEGVSQLGRIDLRSGAWQPLATPLGDIVELRTGDGFVVVLAGSPTTPEQLVRIDLADGRHTVLAHSSTELPPPGCLSWPQPITYPSADGRIVHAFHYAPTHEDHVAPAGERPPLIVTSHGGPTSMSSSSLRLSIQYWTSRGFAVLDVNYGGSSGYGRAYRELLKGQWGVVDVEDCVAGARHLAQCGSVDAQRLAIRGFSASGFTTLCALTFHTLFGAGASYYGVSDLKGLDDETHKFESHYTASLVAPPSPERAQIYRDRSPLLHADMISCPMIFFQGLDDKVVPPSQSEAMVQALKARGVPVAYLSFEGEGHGFRRQQTIQRTLEAEFWFYARVFGFELADDIEPVPIHLGTDAQT